MPTADQFPVKWMHSGMPRAPQLTLADGDLVAILDALLVTGWGAMTPQRVHVRDGVATVTCDVGDTFEQHTVIELTGAEQAALNGQHRVLTSGATSFTFATEAPDGYATGTISIKAAPAGWEKVFAGVNKAVYRSTAPTGSGVCYRVEGKFARGYLSMSDVDTRDYPFPAEGEHYFHNNIGGAPFQYNVFSDGAAVIFAAQFRNTDATRPPAFFGELAPFTSGLGALSREALCFPIWGSGNQGALKQAVSSFFAPSIDSVGASTQTSAIFATLDALETTCAEQGALVFSRALSGDRSQIRGFVPGLFSCLSEDALSYASTNDTVRAQIDGKERTLLLVPRNDAGTFYDPAAIYGVDITGPWR